MNLPEEEKPVASIVEEERERKENETLAHGYLTPRHRRFAQLAASGATNRAIAEELGITPTRVSILIRNEAILAEIVRLQEKVFEETIVGRMKSFTEPAMNVILSTLTDVTGHVKSSEKLDAAKWVIEMQHGKATQKIEGGENLLSALMDRLDSRSTTVNVNVKVDGRETESIDVTPNPDSAPKELEQRPKSEEDLLDVWVDDFTRQSPEK